MFSRIHKKKNKGFSLVELMVVVSIFLIISGITLFNYGKFSSNLVVTNLAYQAALAVRQAQVYGISVKQTLTGNKFNAPYGVSFNKSDLQHFRLFADKDSSNQYTDSSEDEEMYELNGGNQIKYFCVGDVPPDKYCSNGSKGLTNISIVFIRPNPNALIYGFNGANGVDGNSKKVYPKAEIVFSSARGDKMARLTVTNTGQISVDSCGGNTNRACPTE